MPPADGTSALKVAGLARTPPGDLGPFYPIEPPRDTDADLTRARSTGPRALGSIIEISGRVLFRDGTAQPNARLEVWQANAVGRYAHPGDTRAEAPLDPNFQGYADLKADADGNFRFLTVRPGTYPVEGMFQRSPHIHFDIRGRDRRLVTQMYFSDTDANVLAQDKLLEHDMWGRIDPLPSTIFANRLAGHSTWEANAPRYEFNIVL
jgi:protocatechuate 3,4-dioxygenase beta subunit